MGDGMMTLEELTRSVEAQRKILGNMTSLISIGETMLKEGWDVAFQLSSVTGASIHVAFDGPREDAPEAVQPSPEDAANNFSKAFLFSTIAKIAELHGGGEHVPGGPDVIGQRGPEIVSLPTEVPADDDTKVLAEVAAPVPAVEPIPVDAEDYRTGPYTDGELEKLTQLYGAGKTVPEIAKVLGRRNQSVGSKIKYMLSNGQLANREAAPAPAPVVAEPEPVLSPEALSYLGKLKGLKADPAFDAVTELAMCKALLDGQQQNMVAADLGVDGKAMMKRFRLICGSAIGTGKMATEALIEALQYRADLEVA
ncbi:hypothetical protein [Thioclava sp. GXIMD4215]|uniref:hypothetical protein n=1 Tax=Thioclava sp. GXIMD4215 TaxID=3131928 RepID=UPI00324BF667